MGYDYNSPIEITNPYDVRMSAVIRELGTEGEILKIEIIEPSFGYPVYPVNDTTKPTITFENTGYPGAAIVEPVMGALFEYPGYYVNTDGFLDSIEKLRDDYYYQEFSYVLRTHTNRVDWYDIVHKLIHPAGMIVFNNFLIEPDLIFVGPRLTSRWGSSIRIRTDINSAVDVFNGIPIRKIYNTFTGDGYKTDFILSNNILDINSIPAGEKPIQIFIDGVEITDSEIINYYIIDNNQIVFVDAPSNGSEIVFSFYASFYPVTTRQTIQDLSQQDFTKIGTTYRSIDQNAFRNIPSQMYPSNLLVIPGEPIQKSGFTSLGTTLNAPLNGDLRSYLVPGTIIIKQSTNEIKIVHSVASDGQTAIIDSAFSADLIITDFVSIKPETYAFYSLSDLADVKLDQLVKGTPKTNIQPRVTVIRPGFYILGSIAYAGAGLSGLNVNISGPVIRTVKTDINGQFIFSGLPVGSYTITPTDLDWQYLPTSLVVDLTTNNVSNADFAAIAKDYSITGTILNLGLPESNVSMELLPDFADLWALELDNNQISDISILSNFLSLVILGLDDNQIDDITPLTGLTNLSQLFLARNQISDISPLTGHTALYQLWLQGNQIDDITPLSLCTGIANLEISSNLISDISPLAGMTGMDALWMSANQISDISALSGITDITTLVFENNQVSNISPLSGLTNLINLYMGANQISNISALSGMTNLITLYMFNNQISNISSLSGLTTIENLIAWQNQVSDISSVSGMVSMKNFDFSQNQISSIAALSGMTGMQNLWLGGNQISDISPLSGMVNLNQLWLWGNQISDISALSGMTNLKILNLSNNLITDISVLLNLTALTDVYIVGVPLTPSNMDVINTLISRGVNVTYV